MLFNLNNPFERNKFKEYCNEQYKKGGIVEVKRKHRQRSSAQNRYLHLILGFFATEFGYTLDEVKVDIFKRLCNKDIFLRERDNTRTGKKMSYLRSSTELNTEEMLTAIERFRFYSASEAGLYIPAPNEEDALIFIQQQIEKCKDYV